MSSAVQRRALSARCPRAALRGPRPTRPPPGRAADSRGNAGAQADGISSGHEGTRVRRTTVREEDGRTMATGDSGPMIVSACLVGMRCVCYPNLVTEDADLAAMVAAGHAIPICPEQAGGLPTPRPAAGIVGGDGNDLWARPGVVFVRNTEGVDVTDAFMRGAREVLHLSGVAASRSALLRDGSPSCGVDTTNVYDEKGALSAIPGPGIVAPLLRSAGVEVLSYARRPRSTS